MGWGICGLGDLWFVSHSLLGVGPIQPSIHWTVGRSLEVKWPGYEADHLHTSAGLYSRECTEPAQCGYSARTL